MENRRKFLKLASATSLAGITGLAAASCDTRKTPEEVNINFNKTYRWKMTTTWPPNFPILGEACHYFADWVRRMSGGRMDITVYGGGELIPALEGFDAVRNGAVEMNHGAAYYWAGKIPSAQFFATVPFGLNAQEMSSWIQSGGGQELWKDVYAPFDLLPAIAGNTGVQMGGWFNKEINTIDDLKGLKMRIPGLGGKVFAKAGGTPVLQSGGEVYTNLERGVIDAAEWISPFYDYNMGFYQVAKYYYYPGWHEPGSVLEMLFNKSKFYELPEDLQEILKTGCHRMDHWLIAESNARNGAYLKKLREETATEFRSFPTEVLDGLKRAANDVLTELTQSDPQSKIVYESMMQFKSTIRPWMEVSEKVFYETM